MRFSFNLHLAAYLKMQNAKFQIQFQFEKNQNGKNVEKLLKLRAFKREKQNDLQLFELYNNITLHEIREN